MEKIIFDAKEAIVGRLGTVVAKELLRGNEVIVLNSEESIMSGNKEVVVNKLKRLKKMGQGASMKGPKIIKSSDRLLKRMIRGMLPWDKPRGREAYKRLKCYIGIPKTIEGNDLKKIKKISNKLPRKFSKLKEISSQLS